MADWIDINLPYGHVYNMRKPYEEKDSFSKRELNKPGTLVKMASGKTYLIGHINVMRGVCDDCVEFNTDDIVVKYRALSIEG